MTGIVHSYLDIILKLTSHLGHEQVHVWYFAARKLQFRLRSGSHKKGYLIKFASLAKSFIDKKVKNRTTNVPWLNLAFELVRKYHNWHNTVYICGN